MIELFKIIIRHYNTSHKFTPRNIAPLLSWISFLPVQNTGKILEQKSGVGKLLAPFYCQISALVGKSRLTIQHVCCGAENVSGFNEKKTESLMRE